MNSITKSVTILLVEDDPGHARLVEKNLRRANIHNPIVKFEDGSQAMDYLFGEGTYSGNPIPENLLVLLDLNLPVMDGYQVLRRMKAEESTRRIPVIILTTTDDPREISRCYDLGCNVYITKPVDYNEFSEAIRKLGLFLSVVVIPREGSYSHE
ncbi:response regulator [uncultured Desulfosarcina sp.]|uniref:response regulator n=1 Tax=uncultured Desulfosarcina sp. TaxID=218289 RepID=UPI0029C837D5|nr:response regulator [uncultured Desulfosarcina sp.]